MFSVCSGKLRMQPWSCPWEACLRLASSFPWVSPQSITVLSVALGFFYQSPKLKHPEINLETLLGFILQSFSFMFSHTQKFDWFSFGVLLSLVFLISITSILVLGFLFGWSIYCSKFPYVVLALFHLSTPAYLKVFKVIFLNISAKCILLV